MTTEFARQLLAWYQKNARSLPWRGHPDPYAVWVSEIMLQQTRVDTVIPYFLRWMKQFPDTTTLALAEEQEVLKSWEGLGYYSRARNMHKAAIILTRDMGGELPSEAIQLQALPGIGPYTAAAIASIAFGKDEAVVDGNVKRVLARVYNYTQPVNIPQAEHDLQTIASSLLPVGKAGDFNQAVMDLGAIICTPHSPRCGICPIQSLCFAYLNHLQKELPVKAQKPPVPHIVVTAGVLHHGDQVLIARRPSSGLLGGLWEFPGGKVEEGESHAQALARELHEELGVHAEVHNQLGIYHHAYTHFKVTLYAYTITIIGGKPESIQASEIRWVRVADLADFPMGKIDRMISRDLQETLHG